MRQKSSAAIAIAAAVVCVCAAGWADTTTVPATQATTQEAPRAMDRIIAAIRNAKDANSAAANYARARKIGKDNVELYDAYMKTMLTLGHPKIALYPALELRRLRAKNGTAWGVVGYNDARRGRYLTAFTSTIHGMQLLPDDPGIQHNAGTLMAWYESLSMKPALSGSFKVLLSKQSKQWLEKAKFAEAHRKATSEFSARAERIERLKADVASAQTASRTAARESSQATVRYRQYRRAIAKLEDDVKALRRRWYKERRDRGKLDRARREILIAELSERIADRRRKISTLKKDLYRVRKEMVEKADLLKKAKRALAKPRKALWAEESIKPSLTWIPPAVDGVITPEAKSPPPMPAADTQPASQPSAVSSAEVQLKTAKVLLQNDRTQRAMAILVVIVKNHPNTKAAKEAADLLRKLRRSGLEDL